MSASATALAFSTHLCDKYIYSVRFYWAWTSHFSFPIGKWDLNVNSRGYSGACNIVMLYDGICSILIWYMSKYIISHKVLHSLRLFVTLSRLRFTNIKLHITYNVIWRLHLHQMQCRSKNAAVPVDLNEPTAWLLQQFSVQLVQSKETTDFWKMRPVHLFDGHSPCYAPANHIFIQVDVTQRVPLCKLSKLFPATQPWRVLLQPQIWRNASSD